MNNRVLLTTKCTFTISLMVIVLTIVSVWLFGLGKHHSIIENSLLSTAIIYSFFFLFLTIGLYKGVKLKDDLGTITNRFNWEKTKILQNFFEGSDIPSTGDDIGGVFLSIILWLLFSFVFSILFWLFGAFMWMTVLIFMAMLYWIFFRALRLVFKKSPECKGQLDRSIMYAFFYTTLYTFWIFGIICLTTYF